MDEPIIIALPSLIHRVGSEKAQLAKAMAVSNGCLLKRVRRSRYWQLTGTAIDVQSFTQCLQHRSDGMLFIIKKLNDALVLHQDKLEPPQRRLQRLLTENPSMALSQLMEITNCTLAEARIARFECDE
ncbi:ribosome recycling factor [Vibrio sp. UCD-FRSSP16_10]|nr:ribosome recycling factor [Vibrio sp. UCD-FRSSP16_30]OBT22911.1 ribosome recycling factor [Vibrio sp. UCD-FRSSP16_10]